MKVFLLKVLIVKRSQSYFMFSFLMLTLTRGIDILFEKLTPETGE